MPSGRWSIFSLGSNRSLASRTRVASSLSKFNDERSHWYQELVDRLVQKEKELELLSGINDKLVVQNQVLEANLQSKTEEASALGERLEHLTDDLDEMEANYNRALAEIQTLRSKLHGSPTKKDESDDSKRESLLPFKFTRIFARKHLATVRTERSDRNELRPDECGHAVENATLRTKLKAKRDSPESELDRYLAQRDKALQKFKDMLKRCPFDGHHCIVGRETMECNRTIASPERRTRARSIFTKMASCALKGSDDSN